MNTMGLSKILLVGEQLEDDFGVFRIEIARVLIGDNNLGLIDDRASDCHALGCSPPESLRKACR